MAMIKFLTANDQLTVISSCFSACNDKTL